MGLHYIRTDPEVTAEVLGKQEDFGGCYSTPHTSWGGAVDKAHLFLHEGRLGEPAGTSHFALSSASSSASQASCLWRMGTRWASRPGSGLHWLWGSWGTSGHEPPAVLSLPSHLLAGLFLGAEATKKAQNGRWAADVEEGRSSVGGVRHSPRIPGSVRLSSQALEALAQDTDRDSWGRPWGVGWAASGDCHVGKT